MNQPPNPDFSAIAAKVEAQLTQLCADLILFCNAHEHLPTDEVRNLIVFIDESMIDQAGYEAAAGVELLTPGYFQASACMNDLRAHLVAAVATAEQ